MVAFNDRYSDRYRNAIVELLLKAGADLDVTDKKGNSSLHCSVLYKYEKRVKELLKYGADVAATNNDGETPLQMACNAKIVSNAILELLLKAGSDLDVTDKKGNSPLHCLVFNK